MTAKQRLSWSFIERMAQIELNQVDLADFEILKAHFGVSLPDWGDALGETLKEMTSA